MPIPIANYVLFHCVSSGLNGADLGSDESEIVMLICSIVDLKAKKVVGQHKYPVRPTFLESHDGAGNGADENENDVNRLSEPVASKYRLTEELLRAAPPLEAVIEQFDREVAVRLCEDSSEFRLVTDGQLHVRQCLFPEAQRKGITLPAYYYHFHDLKKEFASANPDWNLSTSLDDMAVGGGDEAVDDDDVTKMETVALKLLGDMVEFHEPDAIQTRLEQGIRSRSDSVDGNCCVRARGLPWQASDQDIARFFVGLNIAKGGVALCLSGQGRRNGEALVLFENVAHRDMALSRHKHHIGNRYIEVYKATGEDFISVAGGSNKDAQQFLSRGGQVIIRMRGLPYDATAKQVTEFFSTGSSTCNVLDDSDGVLFVKRPDGRATGDAFVLFGREEDAESALQKHKEIMGSRYIELFRSTTAEVQQVLNRTMESNSNGGNSSNRMSIQQPSSQPLIAQVPGAVQVAAAAVLPQQMITAGTRKDCIRLRGLPYEAQVEHILDFLGDHAKSIVYQGVHMVYNAQGQPSGEAFIQMSSEQTAFLASQSRHNRYMGFGKKQRYIEVFQCSGDDMNLVLTGNSNASNLAANLAMATVTTSSSSPKQPLPAAAVAGILPPPGSGLMSGGRYPSASHPPQLFYWPYPSPLLNHPMHLQPMATTNMLQQQVVPALSSYSFVKVPSINK